MHLWTEAKYWARSRSYRFMRDRHSQNSAALSSFVWNGKTLYYRPGTSDAEVIYKILLKPAHKREYQFPPSEKISTIFDIGANIGASTLLLSQQYPNAHIYAFEPVPENVEVLRKNTESIRHAVVLPYALGTQDETRELFHSDDSKNRGGYSLFASGSNLLETVKIKIRGAQTACDELVVSQVDLIKIDTEGAEFDILTALQPALLSRTQWILGELHGERDFELLAYLSQWFDVQINKPLNSRLSHFTAKNKTSSGPL